MLGFLFNCVWGLIKLHLFTLGVVTFFRSPLGWPYATVNTLDNFREVATMFFFDSSNWIDPISY